MTALIPFICWSSLQKLCSSDQALFNSLLLQAKALEEYACQCSDNCKRSTPVMWESHKPLFGIHQESIFRQTRISQPRMTIMLMCYSCASVIMYSSSGAKATAIAIFPQLCHWLVDLPKTSILEKILSWLSPCNQWFATAQQLASLVYPKSLPFGYPNGEIRFENRLYSHGSYPYRPSGQSYDHHLGSTCLANVSLTKRKITT